MHLILLETEGIVRTDIKKTNWESISQRFTQNNKGVGDTVVPHRQANKSARFERLFHDKLLGPPRASPRPLTSLSRAPY